MPKKTLDPRYYSQDRIEDMKKEGIKIDTMYKALADARDEGEISAKKYTQFMKNVQHAFGMTDDKATQKYTLGCTYEELHKSSSTQVSVIINTSELS